LLGHLWSRIIATAPQYLKGDVCNLYRKYTKPDHSFQPGSWVDVKVLQRRRLGGPWLHTGRWQRARVLTVHGKGPAARFDLVDMSGQRITPALTTGIRGWHLRNIANWGEPTVHKGASDEADIATEVLAENPPRVREAHPEWKEEVTNDHKEKESNVESAEESKEVSEGGEEKKENDKQVEEDSEKYQKEAENDADDDTVNEEEEPETHVDDEERHKNDEKHEKDAEHEEDEEHEEAEEHEEDEERVQDSADISKVHAGNEKHADNEHDVDQSHVEDYVSGNLEKRSKLDVQKASREHAAALRHLRQTAYNHAKAQRLAKEVHSKEETKRLQAERTAKAEEARQVRMKQAKEVATKAREEMQVEAARLRASVMKLKRAEAIAALASKE